MKLETFSYILMENRDSVTNSVGIVSVYQEKVVSKTGQ